MWIALGLKVFGVGRWLKEAFLALLGFARRCPWQTAVIVLLALSAWLWRGKNTAQDELASAIAAYTLAQEEAQAKQDAQDVADIVGQTARNTELEKAHALNEIAVRDAVAAYKRSHSLRPQTCSATSTAGASGLPSDPAAPAAPGGAADMVAVSPGDLDTLTAGAVQGAECTGFLNGLVREGLAVGR